MVKRRLLILSRVVLAVSLLYLLFHRVELSKIILTLKEMNLSYLSLAFLIAVLPQPFFSIIRWKLLLATNRIAVPFGRLSKYHFISIFAQSFLPTSIGGDPVKALYAFREGSKAKVINSILLARASGLFSLAVLVLIALFFAEKNKQLYTIGFYVLILLSLMILVLLVVFKKSYYQRLKAFSPIGRLLSRTRMSNLIDNLAVYKDYRVISLALLYSFLIQAAMIIKDYYIFKSLSLNVSLGLFFIYIPIIYFATLLPISINGIGIREGLLLYFFKDFINSKSDILSVAIILYFFMLVVASIGGMAFLWDSLKGKRIKGETG
ncbi:MAG: flippase-like domain-containing protein [Nitrospirae bacterium]|nr:flippase-like domain-containing protein [Nitrospirota bacterium]